MTYYKQIYIINNDLKMGCGKIAAQTSHGTVLYMEYIDDFRRENELTEPVYLKWRNFDIYPIGTMTKIVLKATESELNSLCNIMDKKFITYFKVFDLGKTQVEAGSFTCVCVEPLDEVQCDELFRHLKLL